MRSGDAYKYNIIHNYLDDWPFVHKTTQGLLFYTLYNVYNIYYYVCMCVARNDTTYTYICINTYYKKST